MRFIAWNGGLVLTLFSFAVTSALGQTKVDHRAVCGEIAGRLTNASSVYFPGSVQYEEDVHHWARSSGQPSVCTVEPGNAADVGVALQVIGQGNTLFSVKSGGHAFNRNTSSTPGVLIVTSRFNQIEYHQDDQTVTVGVGVRWEEVYAVLAPYKRTTTGARVPDVGVGGFIAGGGYSFISNKVGLAIDNVVSYEHVLPNGTVTVVTAASNPELFWALKGTGNNFGVITKVTLKTYPQGLVWGGARTLPGNATDAMLQAMANWDSRPSDPNSGLLIFFSQNPKIPGTTITLDMFYDEPSPPSGLFDDLLAIPYSASNVSTRTFMNFFTTQALTTPIPELQGEQIIVNKYPLPVLKAWIAEYNSLAQSLQNTSVNRVSTSFQPFTPSLLSHAYPLPGFHTPSAWPPTRRFATFTNSLLATHTSPSDARAVAAAVVRAGVRITEIAARGGVVQTAPGARDAVKYPNNGHWLSEPREIWGSALPRLRRLARKYDPQGLMRRAGGFKFE